MIKRTFLLLTIAVLVSMPVAAQQTGSISGVVTLNDGSPLPGVVVEASGDVLPRPRSTVTSATGRYRLPQLPPGNYEVRYTMDGMGTQVRAIRVLLDENLMVDVELSPSTVEESIEVIAEAPLIDVTSAELKTAVTDEVIDQLPVGQEFQDLVKLIPGVQYTEDSVRGPSAGGNGQDNVYQFDGVDVSLPLFGTLSAEPSSYDIEQISIVKGGAKALDFNRSGGFTINSVSKSGTNEFHGEASYQVQTDGMTGNRDVESASDFQQDEDWAVLSIGGPVVSERLFFYTSYYRPTVQRNNRSNVYGSVPNFESTRDELFGKLTYTPLDRMYISGSYRDSDRKNQAASVGGFSAASTSTGGDSQQAIAILEGSYIFDEKSFANFKYTDFDFENSSRPDTLFNFPISIGGTLDVGALDTQGFFSVPQPIDGQTAFNQFIQPLIDQYGYVDGGARVGGGSVGGGSTINNQDFFRESFQVGYDRTFGSDVTHDVHVGYQRSKNEEDLARMSNGWGVITVPGGRSTFNGMPIFYEARFEQMSLEGPGGSLIPTIHSEFESQSIELNDTIRFNNWTFNAGVLLSNDTYYGQGLRKNSSNLSGFELAPGNRYEMYDIGFDEMIQPRLGAIWAYNGSDTVYANYARYNPAASSLPRAASWDRNLARSIRAYFDEDGNQIGVDPVRSSSGKFFDDNLDPRSIDEYLIGTNRQLNSNWTGRAHVRYRKGGNFWEDTNNNARSRFEAPANFPQEDYIPNLGDVRAEIGGSSYVIAELDNAFTKYYEASFEAERRGPRTFFRGSYVWSHYYGNFDQDNTTTSNDANTFIGSSFIADGAGRQLWNFRYGDLRGDRRHQLKMYGYYNFDWNGSVGAYAVYQSGQPWEAWDVEVYRQFTGSTSDTSRFAEPAGSRTTSSHYQVDLNYTQDFALGDRFNLQLRADVFNVTDNQTGYNIQNKVNSAGFGQARSFYEPRRLQLALKLQF